eukprot:TRINITY_DN19180_c0_g1_i1.p5 TRINITY_DN19180_c0_g1~~TRINITY_DN19180_c0_g1_i1.p5  ORF type:complete len:132 (+),score=10.94 TRINITY_DN19180_c0_g1_i1:705-1100(+)
MEDHRRVAKHSVKDLRQVASADLAERPGMDIGDREEDLLFSFPLHDERDLRHDHTLTYAPEKVVELMASLGEVGEEGIGQFKGTDPEVGFHGAFDHDDEDENAERETDVEEDGELHEIQAEKRCCPGNGKA